MTHSSLGACHLLLPFATMPVAAEMRDSRKPTSALATAVWVGGQIASAAHCASMVLGGASRIARPQSLALAASFAGRAISQTYFLLGGVCTYPVSAGFGAAIVGLNWALDYMAARSALAAAAAAVPAAAWVFPVGQALFWAGLALERLPEISRMHWKAKPQNKARARRRACGRVCVGCSGGATCCRGQPARTPAPTECHLLTMPCMHLCAPPCRRPQGKPYTEGAFSYAIHANYTGYSMYRIGLPLSAGATPLMLALPAAIILGSFPLEAKAQRERNSKKYGKPYDLYAARTKLFIPGLI